MKHRLRDRNLKLDTKIDKKQLLIDEDPYKLSIHSSNQLNKSDSGSKRLNISRMLQNSRKKISMRKASQLFQSSSNAHTKTRPQSSKVSKRNQVIEFDNIKWISIISAYDPSRLKNVSVSKKTCHKFLQTQGHNMKTDSRNILYFNDLVKNFKSWINKIHIQYYYIMETFLYAKRSVNTTLSQLRPKLDQVINQTTHMQQNLQDCLKTYQNHQFRQLLRKYQIYLENSKEIQDIMIVVNKSKTKITDLYKKFDDDKKIQEKLNRVKNDGLHQVKQIICQHNQIQLENKIMNRIQQAIDQMAQKSGQAYRKIKGIKHLIGKFKNTEHQSGNVMKKLDMDAINLMGKVCKQICIQAESFQTFSTKFLFQGDIINDDLKGIIRKYEQQMAYERKKAIELQMKFLNIIFTQTIKKLKQNSKIAIVYQNAQVHHEQYRKILRMIQDITDCLIDQNRKVNLQKLIKQTRTVFDRLYDELKYLKQNKKFEQIDTEQGLISILEVSKLIKQYKDKILIIRKRFESSHRDINLSPIKTQQVAQDKQTQFINNVIVLSKKINNSNLKSRIHNVECFSNLSHHIGLVKMSQQINQQQILQNITAISNQFLQLQQHNILQPYFGPLKLQNLIFKQSIVMLDLKHLASKTKQKNIIPQLTQLLKKRNQWVQKHNKISPQMKKYFQRILAHTLIKGLKSQDIKQIQNPRSIPFPTKVNQIQPLRSKAKYRQVLFDLIQNSVVLTKKSIQNENTQTRNQQNINSDHYHHRLVKVAKSKYNFYVCELLQRNISNISNYINSFNRISEIKRNLNSESYLSRQYLIQFCEKLFSLTCLEYKNNKNGQHTKDNNKNKKDEDNKRYDQNKAYIKRISEQLINISSERVLSLTRSILQQQNNWRQNEKKRNLDNSIQLNKLPLHIQKVIQILTYYKNKTFILSQTCNKSLQLFINNQYSINKYQNSVQQLQQYQLLSYYSQILLTIVKYCQQTQQIVHVILNHYQHPIALINPISNIIQLIFPGIKKGKQLTTNQISKLQLSCPNIGIQLKMKQTNLNQNNNKNLNNIKKSKQFKNKKQQSQLMQQDIIGQQQMKQDRMGQQIMDQDVMDDFEDQLPQDQMGQQFDQQQQPQQNMIQDFQAEQQINDDIMGDQNIQQQNLQQLIDESDNLTKSKSKSKKQINNKSKNQIVDDFQQYDWQDNQQKKNNNNTNNKNKNRENQQLKTKQKYTTKQQQKQKIQQQEQKNIKQQQLKQQQKRNKKQHIIFSQTQLPIKILTHSVYQVLGFITSLYQLKNLINYCLLFEQNYLKNHIQWNIIQQYFNNHNLLNTNIDQKQPNIQQVQKYMKTIQDNVDNKLKNDFQSQPNVFNQIKHLQTIKLLKKDLLLLKNYNWNYLEKILQTNHITYNILKSHNATLYIFIKDSSNKYDQFGSIDGYLSKSFKYYQSNNFDLKGFIEKCINQHKIGTEKESFNVLTYVAKDQRSLIINPSLTQKTYQKVKQILDNFANGAKDIVNKFDLCLDLYKKSLQLKQKVDLDLNWYSDQIKFLQKSGTDQNDVLSYVHFIKDNIKNLIKKIKSLESKLYNLSFKCEKTNIFECIQQLNELYGDQIQNKMVLKKGQNKLTTFVFDKTNYQQNIKKIKKIVLNEAKSKEEHAQKQILNLLLDQGVQIINQNQQKKILLNAQKVNTKQKQLLLDIVTIFRVSYSYIFIKSNSFQFFTIKKQKDECIAGFMRTMIDQILENKNISSLIVGNPYLSSLQSFMDSKQSSIYQNIFVSSKLKTLFDQKINQTPHYKQIQIVINEQIFDLKNKNWKDSSQNLIKQVVQCINRQKKQVERILSSLDKLKPCKFIYEKCFQSQKRQRIELLWGQYITNFDKILLLGKNLLQKNHWILFINSILTQLNDSVIKSITQNVQVIKQLLNESNKNDSIRQIQKQVTRIFKWIKSLIKNKQNEQKYKFLVVTLLNSKQVIYFDINIKQFDFMYLDDNLRFIQPQNKQLRQFLFNYICQNVQICQNQQLTKYLQLNTKDTLQVINTQKLLIQITKKITFITSQQYYQTRNKNIRQFVRTFNKIYFISKTSKNFNFNQQNQSLIKIQNQIQKSLHELHVIFYFKSFVNTKIKTFWKGNSPLEQLNKILTTQFNKNYKIPQEQISQIILKLQKIKVNKKTKSIDSYDQFFRWVYHMVMSVLKLPFYNIITHTVINQKSLKHETQFLAVIVTQKQSNPGQINKELQQRLKQMFLFTEHKPIYLKQNDLTVELVKQPVFIELQLRINNIELKQIIYFLNQHCQDNNDNKKCLYLRIDQIRQKSNLKGKIQQEQILLKMIPLIQFLKSSQQQFNLQISQYRLNFTIQCNIVYGLVDINMNNIKNVNMNMNNIRNIDTNEYLPLNGSSVDNFDDVYMGKRLNILKLKQWLYQFYIKRRQQIDNKNRLRQLQQQQRKRKQQQRKRKQQQDKRKQQLRLIQIKRRQVLQQIWNQYVRYYMSRVLQKNKLVVDKIFKKISFQSINKTVKPFKQQILYLQSSRTLKDQCVRNLKKFYSQKYINANLNNKSNNSNIQNNSTILNKQQQQRSKYNNDIKQFMNKIQYQLHSQLVKIQSYIKNKMGTKIKLLSKQKIIQLSNIQNININKNRNNINNINKNTNIQPSQSNILQHQQKLNDSSFQNKNNQSLNKNNKQLQKDNKQLQKDNQQLQENNIFDQPTSSNNIQTSNRIQSKFISNQFPPSLQQQLISDIQTQFNYKIQQCKFTQPSQFIHKLTHKVNLIYQHQSTNKQLIQKQKIMFIYLLLKYDDIAYAELFISEDITN